MNVNALCELKDMFSDGANSLVDILDVLTDTEIQNVAVYGSLSYSRLLESIMWFQKTIDSTLIHLRASANAAKPRGFVCGPRIYEYNGWVFELPPTGGPWPLKRDGDPRKVAGRVFYDAISGFTELSKGDREHYRVGGGCLPL